MIGHFSYPIGSPNGILLVNKGILDIVWILSNLEFEKQIIINNFKTLFYLLFLIFWISVEEKEKEETKIAMDWTKIKSRMITQSKK